MTLGITIACDFDHIFHNSAQTSLDDPPTITWLLPPFLAIDMELSSLLALPHADLVTQLAYSPSSTHLLSASSDASLAVYRRSSDGVFSKVEQWKAHDGPVGGVGWAGDEWGVVCASWGWDRRVCVWREDPDGEFGNLPLPSLPTFDPRISACSAG